MKKLLAILMFVFAPVFAFAQEQVIQGAFNNNGQTAICMLRYMNGKINAYAVNKTYTGQYDWKNTYPDNPHPTNSYQDGSWYRSYSYKVSVGGTTVYFNLPKSNSYSGNSYGGSSYGGSTYGNQEKIVQGVFIYNGQQNLIMLRFYGNNVVSYATSKNYSGYDWHTLRAFSSASPTNYSDGNMQSAYKYKVNVNGTTVYFNK